MRIAVIAHYYPPEIGAPQARLSEMARAWVEAGHHVRVVTCFPNHPTGIVPVAYRHAHRRRRLFRETMDGVDVHRCWVYATPNKGFVKKILGHLSFMVTSVFQGAGSFRGSDIIVVSSPTFFSVMSAWLLSKWHQMPYIFDVRDLWPAIFVELGVLKNPLIIKVLEWIEVFLYRQAGAVVPVTSRFADAIVKRGISRDKVEVITNGVDLTRFSPRPADMSLLRQHDLTGSFVVLYIGAHGISHALSRIVDAAAVLRDQKDIVFLFVGEGAEKEKVQAHTAELGLGNVRFLPGQPKDLMPSFYASADVVLVPLRNIPLFDTFIPSKMFEIMAMGKPIVASVRGESAEILEQSGGALISDPEDAEAIAGNVRTLQAGPSLREKLGTRGREFVEANYDRKMLAERYMELMARVTSRRKA